MQVTNNLRELLVSYILMEISMLIDVNFLTLCRTKLEKVYIFSKCYFYLDFHITRYNHNSRVSRYSVNEIGKRFNTI